MQVAWLKFMECKTQYYLLVWVYVFNNLLHLIVETVQSHQHQTIKLLSYVAEDSRHPFAWHASNCCIGHMYRL